MQLPKRHPMRLKGYDYSSQGAYFVTLCTEHRACLFGEAVTGPPPPVDPPSAFTLTQAGRMVSESWRHIPEHCEGISIDEFVVMPNHVHGVIFIGPVFSESDTSGRPQGAAPTTRISLPNVMDRFKSLTTNKYIKGVRKLGWRRFVGRLWQRGYYEHIIRSEDDLNEIREYITYNPEKWVMDRENPERKESA